MDQPQQPRIRIFRPGTFVSNEGRAMTFTSADLVSAAEAYDAVSDPAPLVIGHPALNDPAWGWVGTLSVENDELVAVPSSVEASFAEAVREGRYPKVSAQFYPPEHPSNPKPGAWYLKHVGFLGAKAPAVKGLGTVAFADGSDDGVATFDINPKENSMSDKKAADDLASFAEREQALATREADLAAREAVLKAERDATAEKARAARHAEHVSFAEALVKDAKLAPTAKPLVVGLFDTLEANAVASFAEAGEMTPVDAFRKLLNGAQPLIALGEAGKVPKTAEKVLASFAAPDGYDVDPAQAALFTRARTIQAENPSLDWMACVRRAQES